MKKISSSIAVFVFSGLFVFQDSLGMLGKQPGKHDPLSVSRGVELRQIRENGNKLALQVQEMLECFGKLDDDSDSQLTLTREEENAFETAVQAERKRQSAEAVRRIKERLELEAKKEEQETAEWRKKVPGWDRAKREEKIKNFVSKLDDVLDIETNIEFWISGNVDKFGQYIERHFTDHTVQSEDEDIVSAILEELLKPVKPDDDKVLKKVVQYLICSEVIENIYEETLVNAQNKKYLSQLKERSTFKIRKLFCEVIFKWLKLILPGRVKEISANDLRAIFGSVPVLEEADFSLAPFIILDPEDKKIINGTKILAFYGVINVMLKKVGVSLCDSIQVGRNNSETLTPEVLDEAGKTVYCREYILAHNHQNVLKTETWKENDFEVTKEEYLRLVQRWKNYEDVVGILANLLKTKK